MIKPVCMAEREIAEIQGDLEEIRNRLIEIYDELDGKYDPKTAELVWGAYCQIEEALGRLWRERV